MTLRLADVLAVLTGRMFWDHVWHESKTSPCTVQESPFALSTISHTAPGCARCQRGAEGRASHLASPAWPGGSSLSPSLWVCMSQKGVQHPWGCCLPPALAPKGCSPGTVLFQIWHCVSAVLAMSQAELRQCLAGKGFPGFMGGPSCSWPPALLGQQRTALLCHHLSRGYGWESAPGPVGAPVHRKVHGLSAAPEAAVCLWVFIAFLCEHVSRHLQEHGGHFD